MPAAVAVAAVTVMVVATVTAMVMAIAAATTTEQGSTKVARGKQAIAKVKRWSSSAQHKNQPRTMRGTENVAREKGLAHRSKEEEQRHTQQPSNN